MAEIENVDDYKLEELKDKAEAAGVSKSGTKQEIADRLNEQAEAADFSSSSPAPGDDNVIATAESSKAAEAAGKEASVPGSDPRASFYDVAPGKTFDEAAARAAAHARGAYQDAITPKGIQYYVVQEGQNSLIDVAAAVGIANHSELAVINGIYNGRIEVRPGQKVLLPDHYTFAEIDNVETVEPHAELLEEPVGEENELEDEPVE